MGLEQSQVISEEHARIPDAAVFNALDKNIPGLSSAFIDHLELEALGLVIEYSLKIKTAHQFYSWSQGLLQNLIRHELLICALRTNDSASFHVDSFSTSATHPALINGLFSQDTSLVPHLIDAWEDNQFMPVSWNVEKNSVGAESGLLREINRIGANEILAHGTHDSHGKPVSFFIFACRSGINMPRQEHLAKLLVPSLHAAWVHTQLARPATVDIVRPHQGGQILLTPREQDILGWIYRGKSNIEIGLILGISQFTVKNHVQKILRRLNVLNRAQAVGKALALRIFEAT